MTTEVAPLQQQHREDFTSEVFKIEITNCVYFGFGELKTFLKKKLQLNPVKIKASPVKRDLAYLCFRNEEERGQALAKLNGYKWKGREIKAVISKAVIDPMERKRQQNNTAEQRRSAAADRPARTVQEATAPLAKMPYPEQLAQKEKELLDILRSYGTQAQRGNRALDFKARMNESPAGVPCRWLGFKASPLIDGYRNKSEFTVGKNAAGEKVVGFRLSSYVDGSVEVDSSLAEVPHIPESMRRAAAVYQQFIRESAHAVFSPELYTGVFKQLTVRVSQSTSEIMLVIGIHSKPIEAELATLKADIVAFFTEREEGKSLAASSIYLEHLNKREPGQTSNLVEHLHGVTHITDEILGLKFRISPESFFQINTQAAEVLYQSAIDLGVPTERTTVMDICCGTGTIGLCFAKSCKQVVGVEIIPQAIQDADFNAQANAITNCKFYAGNCDDYIRKFVYENRDDDLLAIIDPPRAGLHVKSIASLRNSKGLNRFVYISCSPKAALRNWLDLARPSSKQYKGNPFVVRAAVGVDMFPHTHHKEMVLLFERTVDDEDETKEKSVDTDATAAVIIGTSVDDTEDTEMVGDIRAETPNAVLPAVEEDSTNRVSESDTAML